MNPASRIRIAAGDPRRRPSRATVRSRAAREQVELAMTPAQRLTLALELSDLCADLAAAGRRLSMRQS